VRLRGGGVRLLAPWPWGLAVLTNRAGLRVVCGRAVLAQQQRGLFLGWGRKPCPKPRKTKTKTIKHPYAGTSTFSTYIMTSCRRHTAQLRSHDIPTSSLELVHLRAHPAASSAAKLLVQAQTLWLNSACFLVSRSQLP